MLKKISTALVFFLLLCGGVYAEAAKPNFLFVLVDDMAPDAFFENRFEFLKTPNIDRLVKEGAVFENAKKQYDYIAPPYKYKAPKKIGR